MTEYLNNLEKLPGRFSIKNINVTNLFGYLTTSINLENSRESRGLLSIFYGDNGIGKTTLLEIIFHILSPSNSNGHRKYFYNLNFSIIGIELFNKEASRKITIFLSRDAVPGSDYQTLTGNYYVNIKDSNDSEKNVVSFYTGESESSKNVTIPQKRYSEILIAMNIPVYYLSSDRIMYSDFLSLEIYNSKAGNITINDIEESFVKSLNTDLARDLDSILKNTYNWIVKQIYLIDRNNISIEEDFYIRVLDSINSVKRNESIDLDYKVVFELLEDLSLKNASFEQIGLPSNRTLHSIIERLKSTDTSNLDIAIRILIPYIQAEMNRFNLMEPLYTSTRLFLEGINSLFSDKEIRFVPEIGIVIIHKITKRIIAPSNMSTGEKQLLRLFCHTLTSTKFNSIFLMDEPEISLNIKWQRRLISLLLSISRDGTTQYMIATHSMEMLSQYIDNVVKIEQTYE